MSAVITGSSARPPGAGPDPLGGSIAVPGERGAPSGKKVFIKTFGCQMNEYDSDKMADVLRA
ncbi:MAG: hypothetical protein ABI433_18995, partial [Burkholderiaceae bacterium]